MGRAGLDKIRIFRQQTVARVDRICAAFSGHADNFINGQIGCHRSHAFANAVGFIRFKSMQAEFVFFSEDRDGFLSHLICGSHDANGNFSTVCNQNFLKFGHPFILFSLVLAALGQMP